MHGEREEFAASRAEELRKMHMQQDLRFKGYADCVELTMADQGIRQALGSYGRFVKKEII